MAIENEKNLSGLLDEAGLGRQARSDSEQPTARHRST